jgi:hypothetical protein
MLVSEDCLQGLSLAVATDDDAEWLARFHRGEAAVLAVCYRPMDVREIESAVTRAPSVAAALTGEGAAAVEIPLQVRP